MYSVDLLVVLLQSQGYQSLKKHWKAKVLLVLELQYMSMWMQGICHGLKYVTSLHCMLW